jgi:hypothetical protein
MIAGHAGLKRVCEMIFISDQIRRSSVFFASLVKPTAGDPMIKLIASDRRRCDGGRYAEIRCTNGRGHTGRRVLHHRFQACW